LTEKETKTEINTDTKKEIEVIAKTPAEKKRLLIEAIKKTVAPAFISILFAFLINYKFGSASGEAFRLPWFYVFLLVILVSYYIQKLAYPAIGVQVKNFETKDWLYVEFLVVIFFWVFWTLLLN
jgi:Na+/glutamate symporter